MDAAFGVAAATIRYLRFWVLVALMILSLLKRKVPKVLDSLLNALKQGVRVYTIYTVQCTLYPGQCTVFSVSSKLYIVPLTLYMGSLETWGQEGGEQRGHCRGGAQPFSRFWN